MHRKIIIDLSAVSSKDLPSITEQLDKALANRMKPHRKPLERAYLVKDMLSLGKVISNIHAADQQERFTGDNVEVEVKGQPLPKKKRAVRKTSNKETL
jgi:hypothetical protein